MWLELIKHLNGAFCENNGWKPCFITRRSLCGESGYLWNTYVYVGRDTRDEDSNLIKQLGKSGAVILKLMSDLFGKGYYLYVGNWYTSENLASIPVGQQNTYVWNSNAMKNWISKINERSKLEARGAFL